MTSNNNKVLFILFLFTAGVLLIPFITSCGKSGPVDTTSFKTQLQIFNLSPDLNPVDLYIDYRRQNSSPYTYPSASGYFFLNSLDTPFQIRSTQSATVNILAINKQLKANTKYSLFITGFKADSSITGIFTVDTSGIPTVGRGKLRYINASPSKTGLDVFANNTLAFGNQAYTSVSKYIEFPAGNYDLKISPAGDPATILYNLKATAIQDGRLYTLYTYGLAGHTDSASFGAAVITNR